MEIDETTYKESTRLDTAGFIASFICAIHCAIAPLVLASLPLAGIKFIASDWFDFLMISLSFVIASISLYRGYTQYHRRLHALILVVVGFAFISLGEWGHTGYTIALTVGGALTVATSHIVNHFLTRNSLRNAA